MRLSSLARTLGSGALFYVVMAACAASDHAGPSSTDGGGPGAILDAIAEDALSPVKEASADPAPPDVAMEPCDKSGTLAIGSGPSLFALHEYPGKSIQELSGLRVIAHNPPSSKSYSTPTVGGTVFDHQSTTVFLSPGRAAVFCGSAASPGFDSVTFILPK